MLQVISTINFKPLIDRAMLLVLLSMFLSWSAFYNGYPLVYSDTGAYVASSFLLKVPLQDRPLGYGLFLTSGRIFDSLWFPMFLQSLITVVFLFRIASCRLQEDKSGNLAIAAITITILFTEVSKYASRIMPDIFVSWLFLGGLLFLISNRLPDRLFSIVGIVLGFISHNSAIYLSYCMVLLLLLFSWKVRHKSFLFFKDSLKLTLVILFSSLALCSLNWVVERTFSLTMIKPVFYINKLNYHNVLIKTLDRYCPEKHWDLCGYKEVIRSNSSQTDWFMWGRNSPFQSKMGWKTQPQHLAEYQDIIRHSINSFPQILKGSLIETVKQLITSDNPSDVFPQRETDAVFRILKRYYPEEFQRFQNGKQQRGQLVKTILLRIDVRTTAVVFVLVAILLAITRILRKDYFQLGILVSLLIFLMVNAFVIGFTHIAIGRYQGRIFWLLPFVLSVLVFEKWIKKVPQPAGPPSQNTWRPNANARRKREITHWFSLEPAVIKQGVVPHCDRSILLELFEQSRKSFDHWLKRRMARRGHIGTG